MLKTGQQFEDDVFMLVNTSVLKTIINGDVYKFGMRPIDSKKEDIVIKFISGLADQIQVSRVSINCYVPNISNDKSGMLKKDIARCKQLELALNQFVSNLLHDEYKFKLLSTIQTVEDAEIKQHFVSVRLELKLLTT